MVSENVRTSRCALLAYIHLNNCFVLGPRLARGYVDARFRAHSTDEERLALAMYFYHISAGNGSGEYSLSSFLDPGAWAKVPLGNLLLETKLIERLPIVFICK